MNMKSDRDMMLLFPEIQDVVFWPVNSNIRTQSLVQRILQ